MKELMKKMIVFIVGTVLVASFVYAIP